MRTHPTSEIKNGLEVRGVRVSLIQTAHCVTRLMSLARILAPQRVLEPVLRFYICLDLEPSYLKKAEGPSMSGHSGMPNRNILSTD